MITFYGATWCPDCQRSKKLLDEHKIEYNYIDLDLDEEAAEKVMQINNGLQRIPTIVFENGTILTEPPNSILLNKLREIKKL